MTIEELLNHFYSDLILVKRDSEQTALTYKISCGEFLNWLVEQRIKLRDERNEYNRLIREEARKESYLDTVKDVLLKNISPEPFKAAPTTTFYGKNDLLIP